MPHVVGVGVTPFGRHPDRTHASLAAEAVTAALADADLRRPPLDAIFFGSCALPAWGQMAIGGQVILDGLVRDGALAPGTPITNVEAGCATGGVALHAAWRALRAGDADLALVVGVDKLFFPDRPDKTLAAFLSGIDNLEPERWRAWQERWASDRGLGFHPDPRRLVFLDVHELQFQAFAARTGATPRQAARMCAAARANGALNPAAQLRTPLTVDEVLADRVVVGALTRAMCAPVSDGAAAVILASDAWARRHPSRRAVAVLGFGAAGGSWDTAPSVHARAGHAALRAAGVEAAEIELVELHDATSADALVLLEALGLSAPGAAGREAEGGRFDRGGGLPVNPSGGLVSRGHPLAATGVAMAVELTQQLRGEAGDRQVVGRTALLHNAGGMIGVEEATAVVGVLRR